MFQKDATQFIDTKKKVYLPIFLLFMKSKYIITFFINNFTGVNFKHGSENILKRYHHKSINLKYYGNYYYSQWNES